MKRLAIVLSLFIFSESLYGQGFKLGINTGIGKIYTIDDLNPATHPVLNKRLNLRYELKKRWAFEISADHYNYKFSHPPFIPGCAPEFEPNIAGQYYTNTLYRFNNNIVSLTSSAQYAVYKRGNDAFENYLGIELGVKRAYVTTNTYYYFDNNPSEIKTRTYYNHTTSPIIGLMNKSILHIDKRLAMTSTLLLTSLPIFSNSFMGYDIANQNEIEITWLFGIQYSLN